MILIVGLGNPGGQYAQTRHNVGFMCADVIAHRLGFPVFTSRYASFISEKRIDNTRFFIQKPQTFMNLSGTAIQKAVSFYKIPTDRIFVIHDDIDLNPLKIKIKFAGSNGGHNGLRNIDDMIGKNYWRIRIGVGRPINKNEVSDYVLSKFRKEELLGLQLVFESIANHVCDIANARNKDIPIQKLFAEFLNTF